MAKLNITQAAKVVGKRRATLYEHIKKGKLSRNSDGTIDTSELIKVYGELKRAVELDSTDSTDVIERTLGHESTLGSVPFLKHENEHLRDKIRELEEDREERRERERELREIVKTQTHLLEYKPDRHEVRLKQRTQVLSWLNAILIGCGTVITITLVFVAWVLPHLG